MQNALPLLLLLNGALAAQTPMASKSAVSRAATEAVASRGASVVILNEAGLEANELEIATGIVAVPDTDAAAISLRCSINIIGERVAFYDASGKLVLQRLIGGGNALDLSGLKAGRYRIAFENTRFKSFHVKIK